MFFEAPANSSIRKILEWAFYIFIAFFPFVFYVDYFFYGTASRSINLIIFTQILCIILGLFLLGKNKSFKIIKSPITISLFLLLIVSIISAIQGVDFNTSFWSKATRTTGIFYFIHIGLFYLFLLRIFIEEKKLKNFLQAFLISAGLFSIGGLFSNDGLSILFTNKTWNGFTFGNSSFAAMYLYAAFISSIYYIVAFMGENRKWWTNLLPIIFVLNPYFINVEFLIGKINIFKNPLGLIGEAQASSIAMFFSVIFLFVIWLISKVKEIKVRRYILWGIVGVGLVTMVISVFSFLSPGGYLRDLYLKQASNARPIVWELSKKSINERPLLGWGIDNFDRSFEKNYDNTILEQKNGAEAWFDRAHNIFIDQAVETGYVGLLTFILVYIVIFGSLIYVTLKSKNKTDQILSVVVITYFLGHIMELQTGFDTTISYVALIIMVTLASNLFYKTYSALHPKKSIWETSKVVQNVIGAGLLIGAITLFTIGTIPIVRAENANGAAHRAGSSEKRVAIYPVLFGSPLDKATMLWRTLHDFQRGISEKPHLLDDPKKTAGFAKELSFFTEEYRKYANNHPLDYRVRVSLAGAYMYERLLGIDHLNEAQVVLDDAISLYPNIPQAYWMKAVSYLYQQKFDLAREWAKKAHEINPNIEQSQKIIDYIEESIKTFPTINFFTFSQI